MVSLLQKELTPKTTTIVVSHNKAFLDVADVVIIINKGRIVYNGDLKKALPLLTDLSICAYHHNCEGDQDAGCLR